MWKCKITKLSQRHLPSAPILTSFTPLLSMNCNALFTFAILWNLILPLSGLGSCSPDMTSSNNISLRPFLKSSSMFSIWVPAFLKWELHHAVNVCKNATYNAGTTTRLQDETIRQNYIFEYSTKWGTWPKPLLPYIRQQIYHNTISICNDLLKDLHKNVNRTVFKHKTKIYCLEITKAWNTV